MKKSRYSPKSFTRVLRTADGRYLIASALVLGIATILWSSAIARLQMGNADQLADGFLFTDAATFRHAQFPVSHTQLVKWPLFWLVAKLHSAPALYSIVTISLCLITVGGFAYVLARIVRTRVLLATVYAALSCVLVLVPTQVGGAVSSPLSMAMVTGRNVEYLIYILALVQLLSTKNDGIQWRRRIGSLILLTLLFASDDLFLFASIGGACILLAYVYIRQHRTMRALGLWWLAITSASWVLAKLVLWIVGHFTGIVSSPMATDKINNLTVIHSTAAAGTKALFLNFGVNVTIGRLAILPSVLNIALLGLVGYATYMVGRRVTQSPALPDRPTLLALLLSLSAVTLCIGYIIINHPATVDSRYLTLCLFAGFVTLAVYGHDIQVRPIILHGCGGLLFVGSLFGLIANIHSVNWQRTHNPITVYNKQVAQALESHPEQILIGDFWQVLSIREQTKQASQQIIPLSGCMRSREVLTSSVWRQSLYTHSFAYLLPLQTSGASFGRCSLETAVVLYGKPSKVIKITGNQRAPAELLLLYNNGAERIRGKNAGPPTPVFGVPTEGTAKPTGSTIVPLADPS